MKTAVNMKLYEAMFLVDAAEAEADLDGVERTITKILERVGAEIVSLKKWDTRRLAYEIEKKSRGTYILCYLKADGKRIAEIERTVQLSERIMRVLILSGEHVGQEDIERDTPATMVEKQGQQAAEEASGAAVAVSKEAVVESEVQQPTKTRERRGGGSESAEASVQVSEPERQTEDETKSDSELVDEPEADTGEEVEE